MISSTNTPNLFQEIVENSMDGIIAFDEEGSIYFANLAACKLFGYPEGKLTGTSAHTIIINFWPDFGVFAGRTVQVEGKRKDGNIFPFALSISEVATHNKGYYAGVMHDISDLRHIEDDLIDSKHKLDSIINLAVDGIITIDEDGLMEMVNPAAAKLFGYKKEELLGRNISLLMPEPHKSHHNQFMDNYHRTGVGKIIGIGRKVKGLRKDGTEFPFNLSISEIFLRDRRVYNGIIHDISEQVKAEEELRLLNQELENRVEQRTLELKKATEKIKKALEKEKELSELKSRFVSMASHEFRTPLSTILSSIGLMSHYLHGPYPEKLQKHLDRVRSSVTHLKNILDDFLSISKLEEGKTGINTEPFDIVQLAEKTKENMQLVAKPSQQILYHHEGETSAIMLDKLAVENVIINLLSNTIKYSADHTKIQLTTRLENRVLYIDVKDEGMGIPKEDQNHLFERFFRAKNAVNIQGTGLGLNIVKRYVELMQGEITFESKENAGTTFFVKLPANLGS